MSSVHDLLVTVIEAHAGRDPDALAICFVSSSGEVQSRVHYGELWDKVCRRASAIGQRAEPGDRLALLFSPDPEFLITFLACAVSGTIAVPLYPPSNAKKWARLTHVLADSEPALIVCSDDKVEKTRGWAAETTSQSQQDLVPIISATELDAHTGTISFPVAKPETIALLQYTSGSTSAPRGVMVSHSNLAHNISSMSSVVSLDASDVMVSWLPHFHDMGLVQGHLMPLYLGAPLYLMAPNSFLQRPACWLEAMSRFKGTHSCAPNFAFDLCVDKISKTELAQLNLGTMRSILNGAEPIRQSTIDRFNHKFAPCGLRHDVIRPGYGMAETTLLVTDSHLGTEAKVIHADTDALKAGQFDPANMGGRAMVSCGSAAPGMDLIIADSDGNPLPPWTVGEIRVAGPSVAKGYWRNPTATDDVFNQQINGRAYLKTGDLGALDDRGDVYFCGRAKDVIILDGQNHYPQDIEMTAQSVDPALTLDAGAAFSISAEKGDILVLAQEVRRVNRHDVDAKDIFHKLAREISEVHDCALARLILVRPGHIPKTSSGKIQRAKTRDDWQSGDLGIIAEYPPCQDDECLDSEVTVAPQVAPEGGLEVWLGHTISKDLGVDFGDLDRERPFADFGLSSLVAVGLSGDIAAYLGRQMPPSLLFDHPTLRQLTVYLSGGQTVRPSSQRSPQGPVAIVGMSCRFPGAPSLDAYWDLLASGRDAIGPIPKDRDGWPQDTQGGFLEGIRDFDPAFFGISPLEAAAMDPRQRLLLEAVWEGFDHAGLPLEKLREGQTGVFVGISGNEYGPLFDGGSDDLRLYDATGTALSIAANRVSYALNLSGPSLAVDTACSSSLVAVHQAVRSLQNGDCHVAVACGVNLLLRPALSQIFSDTGMLSPRHRCRAFDQSADGYVRSEGVGVVVLKPLLKARADGDRVLGVIRGTAIGHGGQSNGLTAPRHDAQEATIRAALADAGIEPAEIDMVETHGTGTPLGDPIEISAIDRVYVDDVRDTSSRGSAPLVVGSAKSNIGHLEAAAGIAGLIKATLSLAHRAVPASLHMETLNPAIRDRPERLIASSLTPLGREDKLLYAGVSSFGVGGANAHVIIEGGDPSWSDTADGVIPIAVDMPAQQHFFPISAHSQEALRARARSLMEMAARTSPTLEALSTRLCNRSTHLKVRAGLIAGDAAQLADQLCALADGGAPAAPSRLGPMPPVFVYSGQGQQWVRMGIGLAEASPIFRERLLECDGFFRDATGNGLLDVLGDPAAFNQPSLLQPAMTALQIALTGFLGAHGVHPGAVVGHSLGEIAAAAVSGAIDVSGAIQLAGERGRSMEKIEGGGGGIVTNCDHSTLNREIARLDPALTIAAINAPHMTYVTGPAEAVSRLSSVLEAAGNQVKALPGHLAFHSPAMSPVADHLRAVGPSHAAHTLPFISTVTGKFEEGKLPNDYWAQNVEKPVRFSDALDTLLQAGYRHFIEIGPHPALTSVIAAQSAVALPSMRRPEAIEEDRQHPTYPVLEICAALYRDDIDGFRPKCPGASSEPLPWIDLPSYPWQKTPHWIAAKPESEQVVHTDITDRWDTANIAAHRQANFAPMDFDVASTLEIFKALDRLAVLEMQRCLDQIGGTPATKKSIVMNSIDPQFYKLVERWYDVLDRAALPEEGLDQAYADALENCNKACDGVEWLLEYVTRCHAMLVDILSGKASPLETLFPDGDWRTVDELYHHWPVARYYNAIVADTVRSLALRASPSKPLRILECGGGTGGLTRTILPDLPSESVRYTFTDVSNYFAGPINAYIKDYPFASFELFDLNADPFEQGFTPSSFDVILAANAIHLADDLDRTLVNLRDLLAPDGVVLLYEVTTTFDWHDTTVGLIEGWGAEKMDGRGGSPLLPASEWQRRLHAIGFTETDILPAINSATSALGQSVVMAGRNLAEAATNSISDAVHKEWCYRIEWRPCVTDTVAAFERLNESIMPAQVMLIGDYLNGIFETDVEGAVQPCSVPSSDMEWEHLLAQQSAENIIFAPVSTPADTSPADHLVDLISQTQGLLKAIMKQGSESQPKLWLVTQNGCDPIGTGRVDPAHSGLLAFARVVSSEFRTLLNGVIDVDDSVSDQAILAQFANLEFDQVALRREQVFLPRLAQNTTINDASRVTLKPDGLYLITGGTGVLGRAIAEDLARAGVRHILLLSRTAATDTLSPQAHETVDRLRAQGCEVILEAVDCTDAGALALAIARAEEASDHALMGVIHSAGALDACPVVDMSTEHIQHILSAKALGAQALAEALKSHNLDFLVFTGSASSILAPPGVAAYAAANGFLEGFAASLQEIGIPASTVQWGVWENTGATAERGAEIFRKMQFETIPEAGGLALLSHLTDPQCNGTMVMPGSTESWTRAARRWLVGSLLAELAPSHTSSASSHFEDDSDTLAMLAAEVLASMNMAPGQLDLERSLVSQGLDSLMAIALVGRVEATFGIRISVGEMMTAPSLNSIATRIDEESMLSGDAASDRQIMSF